MIAILYIYLLKPCHRENATFAGSYLCAAFLSLFTKASSLYHYCNQNIDIDSNHHHYFYDSHKAMVKTWYLG